jgi:hypothetical protein
MGNDRTPVDRGVPPAKLLGFVLAIALGVVAEGYVHPAARAGATGTQPRVSIGDASVVEGDTKKRTVYFTVSLSVPSTTQVDVAYNIVANGTATAGSCTSAGKDFVHKNSQFLNLSFPVLASGVTATSKQIAVTVCSDTAPEPDETFGVALWSVTGGYVRARKVGAGTIIDDDSGGGSGAEASVGDASIEEGDTGKPRSLKFAVTLSEAAATPVVVSYRITSATATCGTFKNGNPQSPSSDCWNYNGNTKTISFAAGAVSKAVTTSITSDLGYEPEETFSVAITNVQGAGVFRASATAKIFNDDTVCNNGQTPPSQYEHVVVFSFENRTWSSVGGQGFSPTVMPYLHNLADSCSYFSSWTEGDVTQSSMTQYVMQMTGQVEPNTVDNCAPSAECSTTNDNLFRQARAAGKIAINYVEGATEPCQAGELLGDPNIGWEQWVPPLYMWGADDQAHCVNQVRPYSEFDPENLPDFAFITPDACHNGHNVFSCGSNAAVDDWAEINVERVLRSEAYHLGKVAVFIWYDEDFPVPNMQIAPTAVPGPLATSGIGWSSTLKAWQEMLGFPCLGQACTAPDQRVPANM